MLTVWEYNVISLNAFSPPDERPFDLRLQTTLNFFGGQMWELAGMVEGADDDVYLSFKRPIAQ